MRNYLSDFSRARKRKTFFRGVGKDMSILEVGGGNGDLGKYLVANGWRNYTNVDLISSADVVGDINKWRELGLRPESYDVVVAFEVVEHVDCFKACYDLLRPGGKMMITTPVPHMDWLLRFLELVRLNQSRTSAHNNLVYLRNVPYFKKKDIRVVAGLAQWAVFTK
jgi:2-polyprenyl-3-methyl-5-hydroxy-6-metoxy-1,4-benzoquinol methylase